MSKPNKWAVQTAKREMRDACDRKLAKWDKEHPVKIPELTNSELMEIALKDPKWHMRTFARINDGYSTVSVEFSNLLENSPKAAEAHRKNLALREPREKARSAYVDLLTDHCNTIIRRAIIGDMTSAELLSEVEKFIKT